MTMSRTVLALIAATFITSGCGDDSGADKPAPPAAAAPTAPAPAPTGFIEIDGQRWTVVAAEACSVKPGPVVTIAGHAAEDEGTRITVDFNLPNGPTGVSVAPEQGTTWEAEHAMNFDITGQRVRGAGYFAGTARGTTRQAQGRFEIDCRQPIQ